MSKIYLSIDCTPSSTVIYRDAKGIVLDEPNKVLCENVGTETRVLGVGSAAKKRTADQFLVYPIREDGIAEAEMVYARKMMRDFILRVTQDRPNAGVCAKFVVSCGATEQFRQSLLRLAFFAGIHEVDFVPYPIADLVGCGIAVDDALCCMFVDINIARTDIAVLCGKGILEAVSLNVGMRNFEQAIYEQVKFGYGVGLNAETIDEVLRNLGSLSPGQTLELGYSGVDIRSNQPRVANIASADVYDAIKGFYTVIAQTTRRLYEAQTPFVRKKLDIQGVIFCGKGSIVSGLSDFMQNKIGLPVYIASYECTLYGLARLSQNRDFCKRLLKKVK